MKVLIAVPCMDSVPSQFAQSLAMLRKVEQTAVAFQIGSLIYNSRNNLSTMAIERGVDYILWLDSDMTFPPNTLIKLLEDRDKGDIITGVYYRRVKPYHPVLFDKLEIKDDVCEWSDQLEIKDELFEVGGCGFGCVLTPTHVLVDVLSKYGNAFAPIGGVGEDLSFCWRARECGYKIVCDPSIQCGHVGHYIIDQDFYHAFNEARKHESKDQ